MPSALPERNSIRATGLPSRIQAGLIGHNVHAGASWAARTGGRMLTVIDASSWWEAPSLSVLTYISTMQNTRCRTRARPVIRLAQAANIRRLLEPAAG